MSDFGTNPTFKNVDVNGDLNVDGDLTLTDITLTGDLTVSGTVDGRDISADGTKLDGIEAGATTDQTDAQIRAAVEAATDSNVFTDADHSKLNGIEAGATTDQTASEIRALVESATDSNVFTDADHTKLNGIEAGANITDTANVTSAGALMDSEVTNLSQVKSFDSSDYATAAQGTKADDALPLTGGTMSGDLAFGDNNKAIFGAGSDLQIYHDGSDSYISDQGTGNLIVKTNGNNIQFEDSSGNDIFKVTPTVTNIYHGTSGIKLATTSTGIDVTGTVNATAFTGDGSGLTNLPPGTTIGGNTGVSFNDNVKVKFGNGSDLQIYHDGSKSYIDDTGTGEIVMRTNRFVIQDVTGTETIARFDQNSFGKLYFNDAQKLATTSTGIDVTGVITTDGMTTSADINFGDNDKAIFGAGSDLQIYHNGSNNYVDAAGVGHLYLQSQGDDKDVKILSDDGSGGLTEYFRADGSVGKA